MAAARLTGRAGFRWLRRLAWLALRVLPATQTAVVTGTPDDEGNSVEVVRALSGRLPVTWLVTEPADRVRWLLDGARDPEGVTLTDKSSWRGFAAYLRARYVFFTHGLYGSPQPPRSRTFVNLWHGDGPKHRKGLADIRSTVTVAGTRAWGLRRAEHFKVGRDGVLVTGNPRIDQFGRPVGDSGLSALGIDPDRPLVLWMPTYRTTDAQERRLTGALHWSDGLELSRRSEVRGVLSEVARLARDLDVSLVVKPHSLDADQYAEVGLQVLTTDDLRSARTGLYPLLARSCGLLTDYSSVWTDYLALDRPIGFFCPDLEDYTAGRGLNVPDYRRVAPGPFLQDVADFQEFLLACVRGADPWVELRRAAVESLGVETRLGATERLLAALGLGGVVEPQGGRR